MKRLAQLIGEKTYALKPDSFDSVEKAIEEIETTFKESEPKILLEVIATWYEEKTGEFINPSLE